MALRFRNMLPGELDEKIEKYSGVEATPRTVAGYLHDVYDVDEQQAIELVKKHAELVTNGSINGSYTYFVAEQIAEKE